MKTTTKDIIKVLPFDQQFKTELLNNFDSMEQDRKFVIEQAIWDAYYAIYQLKLQENIKLAEMRVEKDQEQLGDDFYKRIKAQTEKEMEEDLMKNINEDQIAAVRAKIQSVIQQPQSAPPTISAPSTSQPPKS